MIIDSCYDDNSCIDQVQYIQYQHLSIPGFLDIGYHFLVGENGKVYEGRGWNREGAHSRGWNKDAFSKRSLYLLFKVLTFCFSGICIIGNFSTASPNKKALKAVRSWIECGIERGQVKENYYIITHQQSQTPGFTEW